MLIRVVRMHFTPDGVNTFLQIFEANKKAIRHFEGCSHLELLQDLHDPLTYSTLSYWKDESYLNQYRKSDLFGSVWIPVKKLFARKPEAFSFRSFIKVD